MPPRNFTVLIIAALVSLSCYHTAARNRYAGQLSKAIREISDNYVQPVDERDLFEGAMDGMVKNLDPYSSFIPPQEFVQFQEELDQQFGGIGIVVELNPDTLRLTVLSPLPGTPADRQGMRAGDVILEIDGTSTEGLSLQESVQLMRGEPGATVDLEVMHQDDDETRELTVERTIIKSESVVGINRRDDGKWNFVLPDHPRIGYLRITTFGQNTSSELSSALNEIREDVDTIVIDLRDNAGGLLDEAIETADMFIDHGVIVSTRGRDRRKWRTFKAKEATICPATTRVAVLVNRYSASASEILAACLQDYDRAEIIGQRTWGKGTVQNVIPLEGSSALRLTTATYWRPSGENIHRHKNDTAEHKWGVSPDHELELTAEEAKQLRDYRRQQYIPGSATSNGTDATSPTEVDPQLRRAVEVLQDRPAQGKAENLAA